MKKLNKRGLAAASIMTLWLMLFSSTYAVPACQSELTNSITDHAAKRLILGSLIDLQQRFLERYIADPHTEQSEKTLVKPFLEATLAAQQDNNKQPRQYLANVSLKKMGVTLVDPRAIKVKLARERVRVMANECPRYRLLTSGRGCSKRKLDMHNFFAFYLQNVQGLCGAPVNWKPTYHQGVIKYFKLLSSKERFKVLYKFHEQTVNGQFGIRRNFFTLFYLDFLVESVRVKEPNMAYYEFLAARPDLIEKYPTLRYLRDMMSVLMSWGGL
jgi:hypothetical protein